MKGRRTIGHLFLRQEVSNITLIKMDPVVVYSILVLMLDVVVGLLLLQATERDCRDPSYTAYSEIMVWCLS